MRMIYIFSYGNQMLITNYWIMDRGCIKKDIIPPTPFRKYYNFLGLFLFSAALLCSNMFKIIFSFNTNMVKVKDENHHKNFKNAFLFR